MIHVRQPCLINVDNTPALLKELEHFLSTQKSHREAAPGVTLPCDFFNTFVAHLEVGVQDATDLSCLYFYTELLICLGDNLCCFPDLLPLAQDLIDAAHNACLTIRLYR